MAILARLRWALIDRASHFIRKAYGRWRWPKPLWWLRGYADLRVADEVFRFRDVGRSPHDGWAGRVHAGEWEAPVLDFFSRVVQPGDTVLDIGAYVGAYTLLASRLVGPRGRVYSLEPSPDTRRLLKHNVAANDATNTTVYPYAVGASSGYGSLGYRRRGSAETHIVPVARGDADPVRVVSLGDFCSEQSIRPSVVKIDVEGAEAEVSPVPQRRSWPRHALPSSSFTKRRFGSAARARRSSFVAWSAGAVES